MADPIVVYCRDIPAQAIIKRCRQTTRRELSVRLTEVLDIRAIQISDGKTDNYLAEWRNLDPLLVSDDLGAKADKATRALEAAYDGERLVAMVKAGGQGNG